MATGDDTLMAHLLGALDPGDELALGEGLAEDPTGRFRLSGLGFLAGASPRARDPGGQTLLAVDAAPLLDDAGPPHPGDRIALRLTPPIPPGDAHPVLWRLTSAGRQLLHPRPGGRWAALSAFRQDGADCVLDVVVTDPPGEQRYVLALLPADLFPAPWPAGDPQWEALWDAWLRGDLPGAEVVVEVLP